MSTGSDGVPIGAAAALFGLLPSTLRWWEQQGVLPPPSRAGGRRYYDRRALRRIGLVYLCCVAGTMPLSRAAVVVSGQARNAVWRAAVEERIRRLGRDIGRLEAARTQLRHLLQCPDDDPVADCPYLDGELAVFTPRGRIADADLVAAARSAGTGPGPGAREERREFRHDEPRNRCVYCAAGLPSSRTGRPRRYCSRACRQGAYRARSRSG